MIISNVKKPDKKKKSNHIKFSFLYFLPIFLIIICFYFLDANQEDLLIRSIKDKYITSDNIDFLMNQGPDAKTWYQINYKERDSFIEAIEENSFVRKIYAMLQSPRPHLKPNPYESYRNPAQIVFYIVPIFGFYIIYVVQVYRKKRTPRRINGQVTIKPSSDT